MELVSIGRFLARRRLLVALGVVIAAVGGLTATGLVSIGPFGAPERRATVARAQLQVDTPNSLLVDLEASNSAIGTQTVLLAYQLARPELQTAIARAAGIAPSKLTVLNADAAIPPRVSPLANRATETAAQPRGDYLLTVKATTELPVISFEARGPDSAVVGRLADAPKTVLQTLTAEGARSPRHQLAVRALTPVRFDDKTVVIGGRNALVGALVFVALAVMWCAAIVLLSGIARAWRAFAGQAAAPPPKLPA